MRAAINKSRARQWRAGIRRRKREHGCLRWSREGSLFEGPEDRDGRGLGNKSWVDLGKERIPGGGNKYEMKSEHNWDVQRTAEEPPGSYLERIRRECGLGGRSFGFQKARMEILDFILSVVGSHLRILGGRVTLLDMYFKEMGQAVIEN